jgi:hypothetical protein
MLKSDALHGEVVSREQVVRSRVWGPCPRGKHSSDDRQTHTAVANPVGDTRRSRDEKPAFSDGEGVRYFHVDVSSRLLLKPSRTPTPPRQRLEASCPLVRFRCVDRGRVKPVRMTTFSMDNRIRATEPPPVCASLGLQTAKHAGRYVVTTHARVIA